MSPELIAVTAIVFLLVLMFLGMPIWMCMILTGAVGYMAIGGNGKSFLFLLGTVAQSTVFNYTFAVLPVFLLMGEFADLSGMMSDAYESASIWLGRVPGGLAMATVVGAAGFSLVSGSSMATSAIMTRIALPQILERKYDPALATGALAAGGTLGNLIPPGILLVIYAVMAEVSLGQFFIACYIPGFLLMFMYMVQIYVQCKINPRLGPVAGRHSWKEILFATKGMLAVIVVFGITLGGIQFGVFTPNEAATISTVIVFGLALFRRTLNRQNLYLAFKSTLFTTGMGLAIVVGATSLTAFIALSGLPNQLVTWLTALHLSQTGLILLIMVVYFILGIPLNGMTIILLTLPIMLPLLHAYHVNMLWFGVLAIVQCELANISPPVGMNLFVVAAMGKPRGISLGTVFRGAIPFNVTCLVLLALLIFFPQISLWLVGLMKG